ncbi:Bud site selection protein 22 [Spathaspora sp. JA1]|nr:Bud site selection protein 22 [Spathaspora sp. JA1]
MVKSKNEMWKLDLLESKFQKATPRFPHTKKLLVAKHNTKLMKKLPTDPTEANTQINQLKSEIFSMKYHAGYKKLEKETSKLLKNTSLDFFTSDNIKLLITSKLIKLIMTTILTNKELKLNPPSYIMSEIRDIITDNTNPANPSCFFKTFCQSNKEVNNFISSIWNNKDVKSCLNEIEWSFRIVRGNLTKQERDARTKLTGKSSEENLEEGQPESESDSESDSEQEDSEDNLEQQEEDNSIDLEQEYEKFAVYDKLVGDSEEEEEETFEIDPNVNYNQVTDEEPSESESESEQEEEEDEFFESDYKKSKYDLPELATGYFSGGSDDEESDDDIDNDKVVKELTTQRKNRRGQRARQQIWAKKYGSKAKHVQLQQEKYMNERQKRQLEFEERERKRELKRKLAEPTGSNTAPLGERRKPGTSAETPAVAGTSGGPAVHPSWEAKKKQEEMLKVKFQGKKITFD